MKCALCANELVCGWWCSHCNLTKNKSDEIAIFSKAMEPTLADMIWPLAVMGAILVVGVIVLIFK